MASHTSINKDDVVDRCAPSRRRRRTSCRRRRRSICRRRVSRRRGCSCPRRRRRTRCPRRRRKRCSRKRSCRRTNAFMNFLSSYRRKCGRCRNIVSVAAEAGRVWRGMSCKQRQQYKYMRRRRSGVRRSNSGCSGDEVVDDGEMETDTLKETDIPKKKQNDKLLLREISVHNPRQKTSEKQLNHRQPESNPRLRSSSSYKKTS